MDTISSDINAFLTYAILGKVQVSSVLTAVILALIVHALSKLATKAIRHIIERDRNPLPSASIFVNIARVTIWILGGSIILDSCFGINTNSLVAALGVGGIAVSLGFQDTLSNLIGGLQVTFMGIISPGDNIEVGSESGVVQDITWRHTTIKDSLGQTVIVPNSIISKTALVHLLPANRVVVPFSIARYKEEGLALGGSGNSTIADGDAASNGALGKEEKAGKNIVIVNDITAHDAAVDKSVTTGQRDIDELASLIATEAKKAAGAVSPVVDGPRVFFSEIAELGIKGKVIFKVEDANQTFAAADAVVRAIAKSVD